VPNLGPKPAKPYPDFPLTAHNSGQWVKKIRGKLYYFGKWCDPQAALQKYLDQRDDLQAGRDPRPDPGAITVKDVANAFLNAKQALVDCGELSPRTFCNYRVAAETLVSALGKGRRVDALRPSDFAQLRVKMAQRWGPTMLLTMIVCVRMAFKFAYDSELLERPVRFGPGFKAPTKKTMRLHRAKHGPKLFTADEVRRLIGAACQPMRAMILLGINCGFGNADVGRLPVGALDLDSGWVDYPRPKTGMPRRCPLWPETIAAVREALAQRPTPRDPADANLLFLTSQGGAWARDDREHNWPVLSNMVRKLLRRLGINGRHRLGFYTLRHTFRTVADGAKDQPAADLIMGHEVAHMSSVYREGVDDARLVAVSEHVRAWVYPQAGQ
jgi:integrase